MLDAMRMRTACFARAPQRCTSRLSRRFLLTFQEVTPPSKTRNQLTLWRAGPRAGRGQRRAAGPRGRPGGYRDLCAAWRLVAVWDPARPHTVAAARVGRPWLFLPALSACRPPVPRAAAAPPVCVVGAQAYAALTACGGAPE